MHSWANHVYLTAFQREPLKGGFCCEIILTPNLAQNKYPLLPFLNYKHILNTMKKDILKYACVSAFLTSLYIGLVASFLFYVPQYFDFAEKPDTVFAPIMMLMLFVFSAAITGALMLGKPILWFLDGKRKEAFSLFFYTLVVFFVIMLLAFFVLVITGV